MAKIMVVDDSPFMRLKCSKLLAGHGHEVVVVTSGIEAIQSYQAARPDGVLLDITMPDMDGLKALKELKKLDANARIAVVTAMAQQSVVLEALRIGAKDFVVKPFEPGRLLAAVNRLLALGHKPS